MSRGMFQSHGGGPILREGAQSHGERWFNVTVRFGPLNLTEFVSISVGSFRKILKTFYFYQKVALPKASFSGFHQKVVVPKGGLAFTKNYLLLKAHFSGFH